MYVPWLECSVYVSENQNVKVVIAVTMIMISCYLESEAREGIVALRCQLGSGDHEAQKWQFCIKQPNTQPLLTTACLVTYCGLKIPTAYRPPLTGSMCSKETWQGQVAAAVGDVVVWGSRWGGPANTPGLSYKEWRFFFDKNCSTKVSKHISFSN